MSDTQAKFGTEPAPPTFKGAEDTPEMEYVDQYGNKVNEPVSGGRQINPNDPNKDKIIESMKKGGKVEVGPVPSTAPGAHNEPDNEPEESIPAQAKVITSRPATDSKPAK